MVFSKWWTYAKQVVRCETDDSGVYELGDERANTLFYGNGSLRACLTSHLDGQDFPMASQYRVETHHSEAESEARLRELLKEYEQRYGILPFYNRTKRSSRKA